MPFGAIVLGILLLVIGISWWNGRSAPIPLPSFPPPRPEELDEIRKAHEHRIRVEKYRRRQEAKEAFRRDLPFSKSHTPIDPVRQVCLTCGLTMGKIYMDQVYCSGKWGEPGLTLNKLWLKMEPYK